MKKLYLKMKYYWHLLNCSYLETAIEDCLCKKHRSKLEQKIRHHEKLAMRYMAHL